jgi:hypothetical protein
MGSLRDPALRKRGDVDSPLLKGKVQRYFDDIKMGTIKEEKGDLYSFHRRDWLSSESEPVIGRNVVFEYIGMSAVHIQAKDYVPEETGCAAKNISAK